MGKITKIVLTGGPCAGKSSALKYIKERFNTDNCKVVVINETASEIALSGLSLKSFNNDIYSFERAIIELQLAEEELFERYCRILPYENVLLVCDRGVIDCSAYVTRDLFLKIIDDIGGQDFIKIRDNYDGVFHLVSAAKGAEKYYTCENNEARRENIEEATILDDKMIECWTGTPHLRVIDNSTDFSGKMERLCQEIQSLLGIPEPYEIEKKFLIEMPDLKTLEENRYCEKVEITQTYLKGDGERVRRRGRDGSYIYFHTIKKQVSPIKRIEIEEKITQEQYQKLLLERDINLKPVEKTRYCLMYKQNYFEIDIYPTAQKRAIMEIELSHEDKQFELPDFIKVIKDVTNLNEFSNHSIAKSFPKDLY